jgi:hypothetical protein
LVSFRREGLDLLRRRGVAITIATVVSHLSLFYALLFSLRSVGVVSEQVSVAEALAAFAFVRLVSALPITPGGVGVVELALIAGLVAAGGPRPEVVGAVLVYRLLTYVLPIPIGGVAYLQWKGGTKARATRADARRVERARHRTPINSLFIKREVEPPPDQFENLSEVRRRARRRGHASRERRIKVCVSADHPRQYELAAQVDSLFALARPEPRAALADAPAFNAYVGALYRGRV